MAGKAIRQRISLEGSEQVKKDLEALGKAGAKAFTDIQTAAEKTTFDQQKIRSTKQAVDALVQSGTQLANKFLELARVSAQFGSEGTRAAQSVTTELNRTNEAAQNAGRGIAAASAQTREAGESSTRSLISAANAWRIAAAGIVVSMGAAARSLAKGAVEAGTALSDQAEKLGVTTEQFLRLKAAMEGTGVSVGDFTKASQNLQKWVDAAQGGIQRFGNATQQSYQTLNGAVVTVTRFNDALRDTSGPASQAATYLRQLGITTRDIITEDRLALLNKAALALSKMTDQAQAARIGTALFGRDWKNIVETILDSQNAVSASTQGLTADQIDKAKAISDAWGKVTSGFRALKNMIGALFFDAELARAQWLDTLITKTRELLAQWLKLADAGKKAFLQGLGDSPAENLFKTLIAAGNQLAALWNDVLVPAGRSVVDLIAGLAGGLEDVSGSQIAGFFIAATIALIGFGIALKGIALLFAPITLLLSLFSGFGPVLIALGVLAAIFWDKLKAGAQAVLAAMPQAVERFKQAFAALFSGDYSTFWERFKQAALFAFSEITQEFSKMEGVIGDVFRLISGQQVQTPWVQAILDGIQRIAAALPGALEVIVMTFAGLERAANAAARTINTLFGTQVTGDEVAIAVAALYLTNVLGGLAQVAQIVASAFVVLGVTFSILATIFGGWVALAILAVVAGLGYLILAFGSLDEAAKAADAAISQAINDAGQAIRDFVLTPIEGAFQWIADSFNAAIDWVVQKAKAVWDFIQQLFGGSGTVTEGGGDGGGGGFARGGMVGGRGSGTSDSNLAWVSRGEYIMPARAVAQPGVLSFLAALRRSGGNLASVLDGIGRFSLGGLVMPPMAIPAFAGGGSAGAMNHVTIQFPGLPAVTGLRASSEVVDELRKQAALAQIRSGGRKPSRYS